MIACKFVLVGDETDHNIRLSRTLRKIYGKQYVGQLFELEHLEAFLAGHRDAPMVVCLDLFGFDLKDATRTVGRIRDETFPKVVFNLYVDHDEYQGRASELPGNWRERFSHYFMTFKERSDVEFEPMVRGSIAPAEWEARYNVSGQAPVRLTPIFNKGLVGARAKAENAKAPLTVFVSYSRKDWEGFVSRLVSDLARESHRLWIDKEFVEGGDDWLDAVGRDLQLCDALLLVLSPDALESIWVKTEYVYFLKHKMPVVPILCRAVEELPFELCTLQYLDFTQGDNAKARADLLGVLAKQKTQSK